MLLPIGVFVCVCVSTSCQTSNKLHTSYYQWNEGLSERRKRMDLSGDGSVCPWMSQTPFPGLQRAVENHCYMEL